jgi:hypothetical protein
MVPVRPGTESHTAVATIGTINAQNHVEKVQTWIDTPVMGDTLVETIYSDYKDFGGVMFPGHIVRTQGGHPVLDITISEVKLNPAVDLPVPDQVKNSRHRRFTVTCTSTIQAACAPTWTKARPL